MVWIKNQRLERNAGNVGVDFGREFFGGSEAQEKQARKFAGKITEEFAGKFVGKSPRICQTRIECSTHISSAEPRDQQFL